MSAATGQDTRILAHGLGGGSDLPIPPAMAIAGGTAALVISFTILLMAWRTPRFSHARTEGAPAPRWLASMVDAPWFALALRILGLIVFGYMGVAAVFGENLLINPFLGFVYVWLWVGIVPLSLIFGPFYKAISPARTIHRAISRLGGASPSEGLAPYPARLGYWPAALGLFTFVWLELVYPQSTEVPAVLLWLASYLAIMVVGAMVFDEDWFARADPFEVYSSLVAKLSVWGRREAPASAKAGSAGQPGELVVRSPLRNLATVPPAPGLVAVVAVLLGSTAYDSFREAPFWLRFSQSFSGPLTLINTLVLLVALLIVGLTFSAATMLTGVDADRARRRNLPMLYAHSVVPIVVGYMVAHYLTFFVEYGQQTLIQASDPLSSGANLLGTGDLTISYWLSQNPSLLATIKVLAIVTGHVLGVIAAHDKAIDVLPRRHQVTGQLPLLFAMVLYTLGGLYLLFGT